MTMRGTGGLTLLDLTLAEVALFAFGKALEKETWQDSEDFGAWEAAALAVAGVERARIAARLQERVTLHREKGVPLVIDDLIAELSERA